MADGGGWIRAVAAAAAIGAASSVGGGAWAADEAGNGSDDARQPPAVRDVDGGKTGKGGERVAPTMTVTGLLTVIEGTSAPLKAAAGPRYAVKTADGLLVRLHMEKPKDGAAGGGPDLADFVNQRVVVRGPGLAATKRGEEQTAMRVKSIERVVPTDI